MRTRRLAHLLDENDITQRDVGAALGMDDSSISRRLRGTAPWKLAELHALAAFLSLRLSRVVTWEEMLGPAPSDSAEATRG